VAIDKESELNLAADINVVSKFLLKNSGSVTIADSDHGLYWFTLRPKSDIDNAYYARIEWSSYPHNPPSIRFVSEAGSSDSSPSAWPVIPGYRAPNDICKAFTAEGYNTHPEWRTGPESWSAKGNPFLFVAHILQTDLNNNYGGRNSG
jgi:hypothetical protein